MIINGFDINEKKLRFIVERLGLARGSMSLAFFIIKHPKYFRDISFIRQVCNGDVWNDDEWVDRECERFNIKIPEYFRAEPWRGNGETYLTMTAHEWFIGPEDFM